MNEQKLAGIYFRPIYFQPTYQKWKDEVCGGVQLHVTDRKKFNGFQVGIRLLEAIASDFSHSFAWKKPPYEYEHTRMPIDLIAGTDKLRSFIENGQSVKGLELQAKQDVADFKKLRKPYLLYKG